MPIYRIQAPDGSVLRIEGPEGATAEQLQGAAAQYFTRARRDPPPILGGVDPTGSMGGLDKFLAGAGQGMTNIARGIGQAVGAVSRDDIKDSRTNDRWLNATGAGKVGNVAGSIASMLPTFWIPGANTAAGAAAIGGVAGALAPSESTGETIKNTVFGAAIGPAAIMAGRGIGAAYNGGKALMEPFTKSGQEAIAARTLQRFATNPERAAASLRGASELVPGSRPTMAQVAQDPGLAQLERTLANNPQSGAQLAEMYAAQRSARSSALNSIAGTESYYRGIKDGRRIFAAEDYGRAMAEGIDPAMAKSMAPQIASLMERPSIQQARAEAIALAKENGQNVGNFGSIEGLDWLKKGLDNLISKASGNGSSVGKEKLRAMVQTKDDLMSVIEQVSPAYKAANDNFAAMSRQVNAMDAARAIRDKFEPALNGYGATGAEHAQAYARALDAAKESVKKSSGIDRPLGDVMPARDLLMLENIARDLARKSAADGMGRAVGSNTAQNLASQNLLRQILGPTGLPQSWAESGVLQAALSPYTGLTKLAGAEQAMLGRLTSAAASPADAASLLTLVAKPKPGLLDFLRNDEVIRLGMPALLGAQQAAISSR